MGKRSFSDEERYAVWTVHGEKCYMCGVPVDLLSMEVDHVIPETLLDDPKALAETCAAYNLPADFDLQSFSNWLPACGVCNNRKRNRVFAATPRIQLDLQIAGEKAGKAAELAVKTAGARSISRAWNAIKRASAAGTLRTDIHAEILEFATFHAQTREPEVSFKPLHLTPAIEILSERNGLRISRGPYGVGGGPIGPNVHSSFICPTCGNAAWSGARCVICGEMNDD